MKMILRFRPVFQLECRFFVQCNGVLGDKHKDDACDTKECHDVFESETGYEWYDDEACCEEHTC